MDAAARSLGAGTLETLRRVHVPLLARSGAAAFLLVFVDVMKELPATLVMRPFNFDTLATQTYLFARDERLAEAALPSLAIVAVGLVPILFLARAPRGGCAARRVAPRRSADVTSSRAIGDLLRSRRVASERRDRQRVGAERAHRLERRDSSP